MSIKIIKEPDIYLTQSEYDGHMRDYQKVCMFMVNPPSFEEYVRDYGEEQQKG